MWNDKLLSKDVNIYTTGGHPLSAEVTRSNITIDQEFLNVSEKNILSLLQLMVALPGWVKWHEHRGFNFTKCGRYISSEEAYLVHRHYVQEKDICKICNRGRH